VLSRADFLDARNAGTYVCDHSKPLGGVMGSIVEFNCRSCGFTTENLKVGWGKEGRTRFWGGLGVCPACKRLSVVDLSAKLDMHRCKECQGQLTLLEGLAQDIPCPECTKTLRSTNLGVWN
jgi:hypothetical protein